MSWSGPNLLTIEGKEREKVDEYVYLGHQIKLWKENQKVEITSRVGMTWAAFGKLRFILKNPDIPLNLKRKEHDMWILPVLTLTIKSNVVGNITQSFQQKIALFEDLDYFWERAQWQILSICVWALCISCSSDPPDKTIILQDLEVLTT